MKLIPYLFLALLLPRLQAEVIAPEVKNNWSSTGFLWVTCMFIGVLVLITIAIFFEKRYKQNRSS